MKIAYCRECKAVIAAGRIAPQQTVVIAGRRKVVNTMPYHKVSGKEHRNVGILDVPDQPIPANPEKLLRSLEKEFKGHFK